MLQKINKNNTKLPPPPPPPPPPPLPPPPPPPPPRRRRLEGKRLLGPGARRGGRGRVGGGKNRSQKTQGGLSPISHAIRLAIRTVPVMLGSLINSFDWKLESGIAPKDMNMEEKFGITLQKAQPLQAIPRPVGVWWWHLPFCTWIKPEKTRLL